MPCARQGVNVWARIWKRDSCCYLGLFYKRTFKVDSVRLKQPRSSILRFIQQTLISLPWKASSPRVSIIISYGLSFQINGGSYQGITRPIIQSSVHSNCPVRQPRIFLGHIVIWVLCMVPIFLHTIHYSRYKSCFPPETSIQIEKKKSRLARTLHLSTNYQIPI